MFLSDTSDTPDCQQVLSPEALPGPPGQEVRLFSQEVELLTRQNEALHQRHQEMLNELAEADREIERLKLEVSGRTSDTHRFPEEPGRPGVEDLERELDSRSQELLEAQALITSLEEHLRVTEALLQSDVPNGECDKMLDGHLLQSLDDTETELSEVDRQLQPSEGTLRSSGQ